jgi:hypothetical protein
MLDPQAWLVSSSTAAVGQIKYGSVSRDECAAPDQSATSAVKACC